MPPTPPPFRILLLESPTRVIRADGEAVALPPGKPLALLAHLHLAGGPVPRDTLAALLWPGSKRDRARGSVRHALWTLRSRIADDLLEGDDPVALRPGMVTSDIEELRVALAEGEVESALELWNTPPFRDLHLDDAPEWARWAEGIRMELEQRLGTALAEAGNGLRDPASGRDGIPLLEGAAQVQPARLQHHVDLVEALLDIRALDEAALALTRARSILDDDSTSEVLDRLELRLEGTLQGPMAQASADASLRLDFVGRSEEFGALLRRWRGARQGDAGIGLILGDAGIGKTRLAEEIRLVAESEGGRVVGVKAEDSERPIEWGLLAEVIQRLLRLSGAAGITPASDGVLRSLMPSLAMGGESREADAPRSMGLHIPRTHPSAALSDALLDLVSAVSEDAPLLLVIDDLHWADTESRTVLARAATRLEGVPALLLFTCRTEGEEGRIAKTLSLLSEAPSSTMLRLEPWSFPVMEAALRERLVFSRPDQGEAILRRIHRTSRGNPLFILELLKVFQDEAVLEVRPDGSWFFLAERLPPDLPLPGSLRALVDRQLDQISKEASLVAAHLARIGHAASPRVLALKTGLGPSAVTNGIGELLSRGLVRWDGSENLTFVHDELRAAVARRYQLHVGLTAGGGAHWSFYRTAVVASLVLLLLSAAVYAWTQPDPLGPGPWGGGVIGAELPGGGIEWLRPRGSGGSQLDPASGPGDLPPPWEVVARTDPDGRVELHLAPGPYPVAGSLPPSPLLILDASPRLARLSPDHRYLAVVAGGALDTLLLATEGRIVSSHPLEGQVLDLSWCGTRRAHLLLHGDARVTLQSWSPEGGDPTPLDTGNILPGAALACSPNDRALLLAGARNGIPGLFLHDLVTGNAVPLGWSAAAAPTRLEWRGNRPALYPVALELDQEAPLVLGIGEQEVASGLLTMANGARRREAIAWRSDDPDIVSVSQAGRITALSPGSTVIRARWGSWLEAHLPVEVEDRVAVAPVREFLDGVRTLSDPGRTSLLGGANTGFQVEGGAPFSLEFEVLRPAAAGVEICLTSGTRPDARSCLTWEAHPDPQGNANSVVALSAGPGFPPVRRVLQDEAFPANRWAHGALVVDAEGWVRLYLGGEEPLASFLRLPRGGTERWELDAWGWSPSGEPLGLRRVRAWDGVRRGEGRIPARDPADS